MSILKKIGLNIKSRWMKSHQSEEAEEEKSNYTDLTIEQAEAEYQNHKDQYVWLDVRTQREYDERHIPGSTLIPIDQLEDRIQEVGAKDKQYMVFCAAGGRSVAACMILNKHGFQKLFNMPGMNTWNGPTE